MPSKATGWIAAEVCEDEMKIWQMQTTSVQKKAIVPHPFGTQLETTFRHANLPADLPIVISGLEQCPPQSLPMELSEPSLVDLSTTTFDVHAIRGGRQERPNGAICGGETRIAGFLALNSSWDGVICLPGRTTAWALVSAGELISFQSFLSVEIYQSLQRAGDGEWICEQLTNAAEDTMSKPAMLAARLAEARTEHRLHATSGEHTNSRLLGSLLGAELAASRPYWLGQNLALIGTGPITQAYSAVLNAQGLPVTIADSDAMSLAGLTAAWRKLNES